MMSNLKPYPNYKPSRVEWLGDVPAHWEVRRLKHIFQKIVGGATPTSTNPSFWDGNVAWITPTDVSKTTRLRDSIRRITQKGLSSCSANTVPSGSIIVTSRAPVGNVALAETELCTNQGCKALVVAAEILNPVFGFNILSILKDEMQSLATGTTFTEIATSKLAALRLPLPPLAEQTAIVRYLDKADERIRRYVSSRERLIELLEEYRQAVIHHAVTRGLDPDVRLKSSGVEWLGDVPAHWEVRRLRNVGEAIIGLTYDPQDVVGEEDGILVLRASNISNGQIVYEDNVFVRCSVPDRLITKVGDILICSRSGSRALIGKNARIDSSSSGVTFGAFMTVFRCANNEYLRYVFNSKLFEYQSGAFMTSTINQLTLSMLYSIKIPLPPVPEQKRIIHYLEKATADIDVAIDRARREIELLGKYRTRLIADVVTGKVDVREVAAGLSDEADALKSLNAMGELDKGNYL